MSAMCESRVLAGVLVATVGLGSGSLLEVTSQFGSPPVAGLCFIQLSIAYGNRIPEK